jgi:hypothetical protein
VRIFARRGRSGELRITCSRSMVSDMGCTPSAIPPEVIGNVVYYKA